MRWFSDAPTQLNTNSTLFGSIEKYKLRPTWETNGDLVASVGGFNTVGTVTAINLGADTAGAYLQIIFCSGGRGEFQFRVRNVATNTLGVWNISIGAGDYTFWLDPESTSWANVLLVVSSAVVSVTGLCNAGTGLILPV